MLATLIPHLYKYWIITIKSAQADNKTSVIFVSSNFIEEILNDNIQAYL